MKDISSFGSVQLMIAGMVCIMTYCAVAAPKPWTHLNYRNDPAAFQFAIVPDRTGGDCRGGFTNALAKVNMLHPEFVMSVGDLIEGYPIADRRAQQIELTNMTSKVEAPFFYVVGNHDIGRSRAHPGARLPARSEDWRASPQVEGIKKQIFNQQPEMKGIHPERYFPV